MPEVMYDNVVGVNGGSTMVKYTLVRQPDGDEADMNCKEGKKWLALYYTKNTEVSNPIKADSFMVKWGDDACPTNTGTDESYVPLSMFGRRFAVNTNLFARDDDHNGVYVFYKVYGLNPIISNDGKYLFDIKLVSNANQKVAKEYAEDLAGYSYKYINLTPGNGYTYMAYRTTNDALQAVRDIRVIPKVQLKNTGGGKGYYVGGSSYGSAGTMGDISLIFSSDNGAGDPILADSLMFTDVTNLDGYEPVCHASGGPAFNLNISRYDPSYGDYEGRIENNLTEMFDGEITRRCMFFKQEGVNYGETEYISGIACVNYVYVWFAKPLHVIIGDALHGRGGDDAFLFHDEESMDRVEGKHLKYIEELGYKVLDDSARTWKNDLRASAFVYSTTYNYKRALKDIVIDYDGRINPMVNYHDVAYQKIPNYCRIDEDRDPAASLLGYGSKTIRETSDVFYWSSKDCQIGLSGIGDDTNKYADMGVYVSQATSPSDALRAGELWFAKDLVDHFTEKCDAPGSFFNINEPSMIQPSSKEGGSDTNFYANQYLKYCRKTQFEPGIYISKICVTSADYEKGGASSATLLALGADTYVGNYTNADGENKWVLNKYKFYDTHLGYITTNDPNEAITDIKLVASRKLTPETMMINGYKYTRAAGGDSPIDFISDVDGETSLDYYRVYAYYATHPDLGSRIVEFNMGAWLTSGTSEYVEYILEDGSQRRPFAPSGYRSLFAVKREVLGQYITGVDVIFTSLGDISTSNEYSKVFIEDWDTLNYNALLREDLNKNAGGDWEHLIYKRSSINTEENPAITGLAILCTDDSNQPDSIWCYVGEGERSFLGTTVKTKIYVEFKKIASGKHLNQNVWSRIDQRVYPYLYYTTHPSAGDPITDIKVRVAADNSGLENTTDYQWVHKFKWASDHYYNDTGSRQDVNAGTGDDYVYIEFTRKPVRFSEDGGSVEVNTWGADPIRTIHGTYVAPPPKYTPVYNDKGQITGVRDPISGHYRGFSTVPYRGSFFSEHTPYSWIILSVFSAACGGAFVYGVMIKKKKKESEKVNSKQ